MKKNSIILSIDTSSNIEVCVELDVNGKKFVLRSLVDRKTQAVLPLIDQLLNEQKLQLSDLTEIRVNPGPGSFTGLRVGVAVANALGFVLKIPINGNKIGEIVEPVYS